MFLRNSLEQLLIESVIDTAYVGGAFGLRVTSYLTFTNPTSSKLTRLCLRIYFYNIHIINYRSSIFDSRGTTETIAWHCLIFVPSFMIDDVVVVVVDEQYFSSATWTSGLYHTPLMYTIFMEFVLASKID